MVFIEGIGYCNDANAVADPKQTRTVAATDAFDEVLHAETDKLNPTATTTNLNSIFKEAADKYNVPESLLKAIAYTESGFQADVTSSAGAMGIMQLMPSTARAYGVTEPYDAYQNIMGGAAVLKDLLNMFQNNQSLAIAAYNAGCGNVQKYGGIPPFKETQNYVAKVTSLMQGEISVPSDSVSISGQSYGTTSAKQTDNLSGQTASDSTRSEELLAEIRDIISALSMLQTSSSSIYSQNGLSTWSDSTSSYTSGSVFSSYGSDAISTILASLEATDTTDTDKLQNILSYAEYQLLTSHYTNMVDIISVLGSTGISNSNDTEDSISDLFQLAAKQNLYKIRSVTGKYNSSLL